MNGKILLFMPTYEIDGQPQAYEKSVNSFYDMDDPEGCEVTRIISNDNPYGVEGRHKNTLHQYQKARQIALDEGYDALVTFEHDMIVPKNGLVKLWDTPAPVVYGVYMLRHKAHCINAFLHVTGNPTFAKSMTYKPFDHKKAVQRGWARVTGVGFGFTLIRREVLEQIPFRATEKSYPPDWGFAVDVTRATIKQIARFDVLCGHIDTDGRILWPHKEGTKPMAKVKILKQFVSGQLYKPGQITEIDEDKIDDFYRAGYIELLDKPEKPAVKVVNKPQPTRKPKAVKGGNN